MAESVYEIMVKIGVTGGAMTALEAIGTKLGLLHTQVGGITTGIGNWGKALAGVGAIFAGGEIVKGLVDIAKHGGEVNHQLALMKIGGMNPADIATAKSAAAAP